jgi:uncharacterized protein YjbI with pentapeptide repeats
MPSYRWIAVSSEGFAADTRTALEAAGVSCILFAELQRQLLPLDTYIDSLIADYEAWADENWMGQDWFIRPNFLTQRNEKYAAVEYLAKWLGDRSASLLAILGDLGTGKSTLSRFFAYNLALSYRSDPLRYPAPLYIPLKEVRKEISFEGVLVAHFSMRGFASVSLPRLEHLIRLGRVLVIFDAFDEMSARWDVTRQNFRELSRAAERKGKVLLTCRTHYFKNYEEQIDVLQARLTVTVGAELYQKLRPNFNSDFVYLQEFQEEQIRDYLQKARPETAEVDWQKIQSIYNLKELAQRPLLLDMIVRSLREFKEGQVINASTLYTVYTSLWLDREEQKNRILDPSIKLEITLELAWRMWREDKSQIRDAELLSLIKQTTARREITTTQEDILDITRELQTATYLKRNAAGEFSFAHNSFMEYFVAFRVYQTLRTKDFSPAALNTRRFDRKIVFFLTLLDEQDELSEALNRILSIGYFRDISENALQIVYWGARIRLGMEEEISDLNRIRDEIKRRLPENARLSRANLSDIDLEGIEFVEVDLEGADLTRSNLTDAVLRRANLYGADLTRAAADKMLAIGTDFRDSDFTKTTLTGAHFESCDFTGANLEQVALTDVEFNSCRGYERTEAASTVESSYKDSFCRTGAPYIPAALCLSICETDCICVGDADGKITVYRGELRTTLKHRKLEYSVYSSDILADGSLLVSGGDNGRVSVWALNSGRVVKVFNPRDGSAANSVRFSPSGDIIATGHSDNSICLLDLTNDAILHVFHGHRLKVNSVCFSRDGYELASASNDKTVAVWDLQERTCRAVLKGHKAGVNAVCYVGDELLATVASDNNVLLWERATGRIVNTLKGHTGSVTCVDFSPSNQLLASGATDGTVRLWRLDDGVCSGILESKGSIVFDLKFSGDLLVAACQDGFIEFWDTLKRSVLLYRYSFAEDRWMDLWPSGDLVSSGNMKDYEDILRQKLRLPIPTSNTRTRQKGFKSLLRRLSTRD